MSRRVEGEGGNREVPPGEILGGDEGRSEEEGGSRERYASWDDATEPEAEEATA
jgi:hypothetical protein